MKNRSKIKNQKSKIKSSSPGVALIMVLGVLTVMVLMAVAFSISMRTERAASGNYADSVRARQLIYVGLARAMEQIQTNMGTNLLELGAQVYPEWGVTNSYNDESPYTTTVDHLYGTASNYVPRAFWTEATEANTNNAARHWIKVATDIVTNEITNAAGTFISTNMNLAGRVAYMIINCSGLVDANFAGGIGVDRAQGTNPNEIAIEHLPEIGAGGKSNFLADRAADVRYETLHDLTAVNSGLSVSTNLFIYSRFLPGYWTNDGSGEAAGSGVTTGLYIIGLGLADLSTPEMKQKLEDAFREAVTADPDEIDILYNNLLHYVSPDMEPLPFAINQPFVELFPMINEIVVSNKAGIARGEPVGKDTYTITNYLSFELWNPFVEDIDDDFELSYEVTYKPVKPLGDPITVSRSVDLPSPTFSREYFHVVRETLDNPYIREVVVDADSYEDDIVFEISVQPTLHLGIPGTDLVDGLVGPVVFRAEYDVGEVYESAVECLDPRFNWDPDPDNGQWSDPLLPPSTHTLGDTNAWTLAHLDTNPDYSARTNDGCTAMYVKNGPLATVGELGYLAYAPWKTIKLYGTNAHKVLDVFAQSTNVSRGLINPNTMVDDALAVAFAGMPVDEYPGGPADDLSPADALKIAGQILDFHWDYGPYTNLSDVFIALTNFSGLSVSTDTELHRESVVRNAAALLNLRQNLFTIIIEAHASKGSFIPGNPAKQRAVAVVWRDPYTGDCFLRSLKWLED